jgi:hypothetical protein
MEQTHLPITEADILTRVVAPDKGTLTATQARAILDLRFDAVAIHRIDELAEKNRQGAITDAERGELEKYVRVGTLLNLWHAKAQLSLTQPAA